ncbi:MAG TPA: ATP-dependent DNA helicase [Pseudomonadales bacterium]|nr:ATP-dependent DNA helicase [Pseudomonadales bacterium]
MATRLRIAVRSLAQLTCRTGDIHFRYDESTEGAEGIEAQKVIQRTRPSTYEREAVVKTVWRDDDVELELTGRADGWDPHEGTVEEFKTSRMDPQRLFTHAGSVHFGQLRLYAALLARSQIRVLPWRLRLLYCDPDTRAVTPFEEEMDTSALEAFLQQCCARLAGWLRELEVHRQRRNGRLAHLAFPFRNFRPAQRALSAEIYRTVRDGGALLFEAPTGSGKTMSALFPSLIAMGRGSTDRVVFLSSKATGQATAETAIKLLNVDDVVRRLTVTAKAKICFMPEPVCDPAICSYARGYYDRSDAAVAELLAVGTMTRAAIETVARTHHVCPFELSLDAAVWSDIVICDYNYVFDPVVRLKRLAGITADRIALLIDEAHQLAERVRDALSTVFARDAISRALGELSGDAAKCAAALDRRILELRRQTTRAHDLDRDAFECRLDLPESLLRAAEKLLSALTTDIDSRSNDGTVTELVFALLRLLRAAAWYDASHFAVFLRGRGSAIELDVRCLDASAAIAETLGEYRAHVRFSATVSPFEMTGRAHGLPDAHTLRLPSPFPEERLGVFVVPDVSTLFRQREATLPALARVIEAVVAARPGSYLVALPSFDYLDRVADYYGAQYPHREAIRQSRGMAEEAREEFVEAYRSCNRQIVGFAVLGGLFTESIDLPAGALVGIVVVGIGLPPPTLERNEMAECYGEPFGRALAYEQPAMTRVIQAAGRLIRRESDRGVVCLIDHRFLAQEYREYLPRHWRPLRATSRQLPEALVEFWSSSDAIA